LVEVLVALVIVAFGLAALMIAVQGTARTSGFLRDKTVAQWIALNRLSEVRLNLVKFGQNTDTGELDFANRKWHYDTRYFDTTISTMKRVVVRVYLGDAKTKGSPVAQAIGFLGTAVGPPAVTVADWTTGTVPTPTAPGTTPPPAPGTTPPPGATPVPAPGTGNPGTPVTITPAPAPPVPPTP
jgi:general secretion pathway protein I